MKRIIIPLVLALIVLASCQTGKVTTALNQKEAGNVEEALEMINDAVDPANEKSEKTISWPRTWEVRGEIYQSIYQSEDPQVKKLAENPLEEALLSYQKALELDEDDKFSKSVKIKLTLLSNDLTNQAVQAFNEENYNKALSSFENILELQDIPIMEEDSPGAVDTVIIFNAGLAAYNAEKYDKAIDYYSEAAEHGYNGARTYSLLANTYQLKGDTLGALEALKEGFEKYPDNNTILTSMIQVYLDLDKTQDAMKYLQLAIEQDPTNATFYFALGTLYEKNKQEQEAIEAYEKAIELDDEYFDAFYNLGALYYNKGVAQIEVANAVPPNENERYQEELEKANVWFRKALPYMERCLVLDPNHAMTLESLKNLYYRLKMMDKYNEILEILGE